MSPLGARKLAAPPPEPLEGEVEVVDGGDVVSAGLVAAVGVVAVVVAAGVVAAGVVGVVAVEVVTALAAGVKVLDPPPPHAASPMTAAIAASSIVATRSRLIGLRLPCS